jgi:hypothetical protein
VQHTDGSRTWFHGIDGVLFDKRRLVPYVPPAGRSRRAGAAAVEPGNDDDHSERAPLLLTMAGGGAPLLRPAPQPVASAPHHEEPSSEDDQMEEPTVTGRARLAPFELPAGFRLAAPPTAQQLELKSAAGAQLIGERRGTASLIDWAAHGTPSAPLPSGHVAGEHILFNWEGVTSTVARRSYRHARHRCDMRARGLAFSSPDSKRGICLRPPACPLHLGLPPLSCPEGCARVARSRRWGGASAGLRA